MLTRHDAATAAARPVLGSSAAALSILALAVLTACAPAAKSGMDASATAPKASETTVATTSETKTAAPAPAPATASATAPAAPPAATASKKSDKPVAGALFGDITRPGKDTPKPRTKPVAKPAREGKIIPGAVNVYTFDPDEAFTPVDPTTTSITQVLADLGPDAIEWYQHVQTLSNPWFEGRVPGSEGIERAAQYCQFWMQKSGLEPAFASGSAANPDNPWRQPFDLPGNRGRSIKSSTLTLGGAELAAKAMKNSGGGTVDFPVAFAGYGIESGKDGYSSFGKDERFEGRVAIVMRGEPLDEAGKSRWGGEKLTSASSLAAKLEALVNRGASAILVTDAPGYAGKRTDVLAMSADSLGGELGVPCFFAEPATVDAILKAADPEGRDLATLRARADGATKDAPAATVLGKDDAKVALAVSTDSGAMVTHNVGGILRGKGALADEWVVVGAHYDHVGFGAYGADPSNRGKLHPGADDNASGTSGMLVMTRRLADAYKAAPEGANLRSVLFLAFSAEEMGLNGSRAYVKKPSIAADKVDVMLNMDMIGRMRSNELVVGGIESAKDFGAKLEPFFKESGLTIYADPSGRGPSDHASFFGAGIPVMFFFSGVHDIYHKPGDMGYTVDPRGVPAILDLVEKIALWRAGSESRLEFQNGAPRVSPTPRVADAAPGGNDRGYAPVRLGIQPGMTEDGESGILVESVSPNTSAADGGIKPGDILLSWNGDSLASTADMMTKLRASKPGDIAKIRLLRDGKEMTLDVELKASTAPRRPQND